LQVISFADSQADAFRLGAVGDVGPDVKRFLKKNQKQPTQGTFLEHVDRLVREDIRQLVLLLRSRPIRQKGFSMVLSAMRNTDDDAAVTALLASELSQQGFRVLLMEMDAEEASLRRLLDVRPQADLYDYLNGRAELSDVMTRTRVPNLMFVDMLHPEIPVADFAARQTFAAFLENSALYFA